MKLNAKYNYLMKKNGIHLCLENNVVYDTINGHDLHLQIIYPYSCTYEEKFPCMLYIQGSGWDKQPLYTEIPNLIKIAERGIVIAVVEYRDCHIAKYPAQVKDTKKAIKFIKSNVSKYNIDINNIFLSGNSSGGHTALMTLLSKNDVYFKNGEIGDISDDINGLIDWYGPTDFTLVDNFNIDGDCSSFADKFSNAFNMDELEKTNPLNYINEDKLCPFLVIHGTVDELVNIKHSMKLVEKLEEYNHDVEFVEMIDSDHGGPEFFEKEVIDVIYTFIKRNLK